MTATFSQRFWRVGRSIAKWTAIVVGVLATLIVLAYWEEDWRGAHDWAATKRELHAKGEILDLRQLCPPQGSGYDLSKVPIFAEAYRTRPFLDRFDGTLASVQPPPTRLNLVKVELGSDNYNHPYGTNFYGQKPTDLPGWQKYYRSIRQSGLSGAPGTPAQDILHALTHLDSDLNEIRSAVEKPGACWPINYEHPFTDSMETRVSMLSLAKVLHLRGVAHLAEGRADLALDDYKFLLGSLRPEERDPLYVGYLVDFGCRTIGNGLIWEGIHSHLWNASQLHELERALEGVDMLELGVRTFRVERAENLASFDFMQFSRPEAIPQAPDYRPLAHLLHLRPSGWWDQDRRADSLQIQQQIDSIDLKRRVVEKTTPPENSSWIRQLYIPISSGVDELPSRMLSKIVQAETAGRLAKVACHLEEFYLIHQEYPESLSELGTLPKHLSEEVLTGKPMHYQRKGNSYMLYSTGWDGVDHGGVPRSPPHVEGEIHNVTDEWDWIWPGP